MAHIAKGKDIVRVDPPMKGVDPFDNEGIKPRQGPANTPGPALTTDQGPGNPTSVTQPTRTRKTL